jgi:hypothetical protein
VLNFKDYIKEEIKKESVLSPIKFLGGFGGNIIGQGIKGVSNAAKGSIGASTSTLASLGNLMASSAYGMLGNKEAAKDRAKASYKNLESTARGLKDIIVGAIQIGGAATLITPTLRGFQAANEPLSRGFNKNRNKIQKTLGLNSNKETPYIISDVPNNMVEIKKFIEDFYEQTKNKREVKITKKPEKFLKKLITFGAVALEKYNDKNLNYKFKFLLNTYFPNFEVVEIKVGAFLNEIDSQKFYENSMIIEYINYLYEKSLKDKVILITNNDKIFILELKNIYKKYLDIKNTNNPKEEEVAKELKEKIKKIVEKFSNK